MAEMTDIKVRFRKNFNSESAKRPLLCARSPRRDGTLRPSRFLLEHLRTCFYVICVSHSTRSALSVVRLALLSRQDC